MERWFFRFREKTMSLARCVLKMAWATLLIVVAVFILDALLFYTMRFSISPYDEDVFGKFWPPSDMSIPEVDVPIGAGETTYKLEYKHRYSGRHMVYLRLERYSMSTEAFLSPSNGVTFCGGIEISGRPSSRVDFKESVRGEIHRWGGGTIDEIPLFRYDELGGRIFKDTYNVSVTVEGNMTHFLKFYKRCSISVKNDIHL